MLHFQGSLKRLQQEAERLGLVLLTSDLGSVQDAAAQVASGRPLPTNPLEAQTIYPSTQTHSKDIDNTRDNLHPSRTAAGGMTDRVKGFAMSLAGGHGADQAVASEGHLGSKLASLPWSGSIALRSPTLGWSGATMWLFTVSAGHQPCIRFVLLAWTLVGLHVRSRLMSGSSSES